MMLNKMLNHRPASLMVVLKRLAVGQSVGNLAAQMKLFNDEKQFQKTIELFDKKQHNNVETLSNFSIIQILKACAHLKDLQRGSSIHHMILSRIKDDSYLLTSLIHLYMQCGEVTHGQSLFKTSTNKTLSMYGAMMKGYIHNNMANKAVDLFNEIKNPNEVIMLLLFNACAQLGTKEALTVTKQVLSQLPKSYHSNSRLSTSLLDALMKCGDVSHAELLFKTSTNRTVPCYGAMMKGYVHNNMAKKAVDLFNEIKKPDEITVTLLFNACAQLGNKEALTVAKQILSQIPKSFHSNPRLSTSLLDASMKCGDVSYSELLFKTSTNKILSMYGAMMKGYIQNNMADKAVNLFNEIKKPDEITVTLLFNACAQLGTKEALTVAKQISSKIPKSFYSNPRLSTSLLDALMKCGDVSHAESLFKISTNKTVELYGAMMKGYVQNKMANKAIDLFHEIKNPDEVIIILLLNACAQLGSTEALTLTKLVSSKIPKSFYLNSRLSTSLLDALAKCEDYSSAENLFSKMTKSVISYGVIMNVFNQEIKPDKTLNLFHQMKIDGIKADVIIYLRVLKALSQVGVYSLSQSMIQQIPNTILVDRQIQNALIDLWGKTGYIDQAKRVFEEIAQPNQIEYTVMINSYGLNGMGTQAVQLFRQIPPELIDEVTYICVLNACSHSGLVDEARSIFGDIQMKTDKIYSTMIDCLSRAGCFEEAQQLIDEFERHHSPAPSMYMALLSGARNEKNILLCQQVFDRMKKCFPELTEYSTSSAVLLANVYASSGEMEKASNIRVELHKSGRKKKIGLSWTAVNGQLYQFRAHDQSHPRSSEIHAEIDRISKELTEHGHQYDASWITRPLSQDETVASVLCGHSERLAIAWNFVANPNASQIQVTKNLRVCGDCHQATKLIAAIRQCEIIVRDANRIHHFYTDGRCSCNDYF